MKKLTSHRLSVLVLLGALAGTSTASAQQASDGYWVSDSTLVHRLFDASNGRPATANVSMIFRLSAVSIPLRQVTTNESAILPDLFARWFYGPTANCRVSGYGIANIPAGEVFSVSPIRRDTRIPPLGMYTIDLNLSFDRDPNGPALNMLCTNHDRALHREIRVGDIRAAFGWNVYFQRRPILGGTGRPVENSSLISETRHSSHEAGPGQD